MKPLAVTALGALFLLGGCTAPAVHQKQPRAEDAPDERLCGPAPLPSMHGEFFKEPKNASQHAVEDAYSSWASASANACLKSASYLYSRSGESVDTVVKAVEGECIYLVRNHDQWCRNLKLDRGISINIHKGEVDYFRSYCGDTRKSPATVDAEMREQIFALVVRARAGRCWLTSTGGSAEGPE